MHNSDSSLARLLFSNGPAFDRADKMGLYGWLIGDWTMDAVMHAPDGGTHERRGEINFAWVLEGRAIQDVWVLPDFFYGTTLRVYDPGIDAWHILWSDPLRQFYGRQIGRAHGAEIVQLGKSDDGHDTRWSFTDITPDSFRWLGEFSIDGGTTWELRAEFKCHRKPRNRIGLEEVSMFDHVSIGVRDLARARHFYDAALRPLGYVCLSEGADSLGYGRDKIALWIGKAARPVLPDPGSNLHFCFAAPTREAVDAFHAAALSAGGADNGAPGLRPDYGADYYAAFAVDPDGYRIEAYCGG